MTKPALHHDVDHDTLAKLADELDPGTPVTMLNLLRFRLAATYQDGTDLPPCSGREAYLTRYIPAFGAIMARFGEADVTYAGDVVARLAGAGPVWDTIAVVTYPSFNAFAALMNDSEYIGVAAPHRLAALEEWGFLATQAL